MAPAPESLPSIEVLKDGRWLFTYVEVAGTFATTDKPTAVPEAARRVVRVIDPSQSAAARRDVASVYVVDLGRLLEVGKVEARVMSREAFETAALAQLPAGQFSLLAAGGDPEGAARATAPEDPNAGATPPVAAGGDAVVLYGTSWCGACGAARRYFRDKKIPFADKDIERDAAAARELAEKAARLGVPADRVPVIDVRGRLLLGFDPARIEALLGTRS